MAAAMPSAIQRGTPAYLRANLALFLAGFATFSLLYCVQPLLPAFAKTFGVSPAESSLALSLSTSLLAFAILVAAIISSSVKRRLLMGTSMILASVLNIVAGLVPDWHTLLASRALTGLVLGGVPAVAMAYLAEEIDQRGLGMAMGLYVAGTGVGGLVGRVAAAGLSESFDWHVAMLVLGTVNLLTAVGFIALLPTSRNFTPRPPQGLPTKPSSMPSRSEDAPPIQFAVSVMPRQFTVSACDQAAMSLHSADDSGADPTCTRCSDPVTGGLESFSAMRHRVGTDDMNVMRSASIWRP